MGPPNSFSSRTESQRLKEASRNLTKLNLPKSDQDINKMMMEMINPLGGAAGGPGGSSEAMMPPPLTAITTPRGLKHEGIKTVPKYLPTVSPPPSPIKPLKASPERPTLKPAKMESAGGHHGQMQGMLNT